MNVALVCTYWRKHNASQFLFHPLALSVSCQVAEHLLTLNSQTNANAHTLFLFHHLIHLLTITDTHTPSHLSTHQTSPHPPTQPTIPDLNWPDWSGGLCCRLLATTITADCGPQVSDFSEIFMDFRAPQISQHLNPKSSFSLSWVKVLMIESS